MKPPADRNSPKTLEERSQPRRKRRSHRIFPLLVFAAIILMFIRDRVPVVEDFVTKIVSPDLWQAREVCLTGVREQLTKPDFARLIHRGNPHKTDNGFLINMVIFGEMGAQSGETRINYNCYVDEAFNLVRIDRL